MLDLNRNEAWLLEELLFDELDAEAERSDLLTALPELRHRAVAVDDDDDDDELGLRSLLDLPEAQSKAWRSSMNRI